MYIGPWQEYNLSKLTRHSNLHSHSHSHSNPSSSRIADQSSHSPNQNQATAQRLITQLERFKLINNTNSNTSDDDHNSSSGNRVDASSYDAYLQSLQNSRNSSTHADADANTENNVNDNEKERIIKEMENEIRRLLIPSNTNNNNSKTIQSNNNQQRKRNGNNRNKRNSVQGYSRILASHIPAGATLQSDTQSDFGDTLTDDTLQRFINSTTTPTSNRSTSNINKGMSVNQTPPNKYSTMSSSSRFNSPSNKSESNYSSKSEPVHNINSHNSCRNGGGLRRGNEIIGIRRILKERLNPFSSSSDNVNVKTHEYDSTPLDETTPRNLNNLNDLDNACSQQANGVGNKYNSNLAVKILKLHNTTENASKLGDFKSFFNTSGVVVGGGVKKKVDQVSVVEGMRRVYLTGVTDTNSAVNTSTKTNVSDGKVGNTNNTVIAPVQTTQAQVNNAKRKDSNQAVSNMELNDEAYNSVAHYFGTDDDGDGDDAPVGGGGSGGETSFSNNRENTSPTSRNSINTAAHKVNSTTNVNLNLKIRSPVNANVKAKVNLARTLPNNLTSPSHHYNSEYTPISPIQTPMSKGGKGGFDGIGKESVDELISWVGGLDDFEFCG